MHIHIYTIYASCMVRISFLLYGIQYKNVEVLHKNVILLQSLIRHNLDILNFVISDNILFVISEILSERQHN